MHSFPAFCCWAYEKSGRGETLVVYEHFIFCWSIPSSGHVSAQRCVWLRLHPRCLARGAACGACPSPSLSARGRCRGPQRCSLALSCYGDPAAAGSTGRCPVRPSAPGAARESGGRAPWGLLCEAIWALSARTAALPPGPRWGAAAAGALGIPLADSALGGEGRAGGDSAPPVGAGRGTPLQGSACCWVTARAELSRGILGAGAVRLGARGCGARQGSARDRQQPLLCSQACSPPCSSLS